MSRNINKKRKFRLLFGTSLLVILLLFIGVKLWASRNAQAAWFNSNWSFRQKIAVTAHTSLETNVYLTPTAFDTSDTTKFQADCGDLRFTDNNGKVLKYFVSSGCGGASTTIHILIPSFAAGVSDFYMYYGNPGAANGFVATDFSSAASGVTLGSNGSEEAGPGPILSWAMDEGTGQTIDDSAQNSYNGTRGTNSSSASDDPTWQNEDQCISSKCLYFDGTNDYVNGSDAFYSDKLSISVWIKFLALPGAGSAKTIVAKRNNSSAVSLHNEYELRVTDTGKILWVAYSDDSTSIVNITGNSTLSINTWYHVEVTHPGSGGTATIYVNGVQDKTGSITGAIQDNTAIIQLGVQTANDSTRYFNGYMDEFKMYRYSRSAAQVQVDYNAYAERLGKIQQQNFLSNGLAGYWKMDETSWTNDCSTTSVTDSSGNGNNGKSCPNTTGPTTPADGKFGKAGSFDGVDDNLQVANSTSLDPGTNDITLSAWINPTSFGSAQTGIVKYHNTTSNSYFILEHTAGGVLQAEFRGDSTCTALSLTGTATLTTSTWSHVVFTFNRIQGSKLYLNGVLDASSTSLGTCAVSMTGGTMTIGKHTGLFTGKIDDVRYYKRALSGSEIASLYNWAPLPIAYWNFDEKTGSTTNDTTGNANTATFACTGGGCTNPTWTTGKYGSGINFTGTSTVLFNYLDVANPTNFNFTSSFTLALWLKADSSSGNTFRGVIGQFNGTAAGWDLGLNTSTGKPRMTLRGTSNIDTGGVGSDLRDSRWHHVEVVNTTSSVAIYIDGILVSTTSGTWTPTTLATDVVIGNRQTTSTLGFLGQIDDVKIYNYTRSASQILEDMNGQDRSPAGGGVGALPKPIAYYALDEQQGQTVNNSGIIGSTLNGTLGADASSASDDPTWKTGISASCKINGCLSFDGTNDVSNIYSSSLNSAFNGSEGTLTAWVKVSGSGVWTDGTTRNLALIGVDATTNFVTINKNSVSNSIVFNYVAGSTTSSVSKTPISDTGWIYVALTWSKTNNQVMAYINGQQTGTTQTGLGTWSGSLGSTRAVIGAASSAAANPWSGNIDEVKIYDTPLSPSQIQLDYNASASQNFGVTANSEASLLSDGAGNAPVGYWNFDEKNGTTANDTSGNGYTGTFVNTPSWTQGKIGSALSFNGSDNYLTMGDQSALNAQSGFTVSGWINRSGDSNGSASNIASKWLTGSALGWFLEVIDSTDGSQPNKVRLFISGLSAAGIYSSSTITNNTWQYVTAVYDGTKQYIYINGKLDNSAAATGTPTTTTNPFQIGFGVTSGGGNNYFNGKIDDVKVYNYARTAAQIAYDYNRGLPIGYWQFDECQGSTINDLSGNSNTGTLTIGATGTQTAVGTCNTSSTAWGNGATGKFNASLNFDGTDDYVSFSRSASIQSIATQGTISFWANDAVVDANLRTGVDIAGTGSTGLIVLTTTNTTPSHFRLQYGTGTSTTVTSTTVPVVGTWYHVVGTWNTSGAKIYINGILEATSAVAPTITISSGTAYIGSNAGTVRFANGQIDDVRIYNYSLSGSQIQQVYNQGSAVRFGPTTGTP